MFMNNNSTAITLRIVVIRTNDGSAISESKVTNQEESKSGAGFGNWFVDKITVSHINYYKVF